MSRACSALGNDGARFKADAYRALMSGDYTVALENFRRALSINRTAMRKR